MYGLVNQGLEDYIRQQFGDANWAAILGRAGIDLDMFVALQSYPDELTVRLIGAGSDLLGMTPESLLEGFGEHWILYTAGVPVQPGQPPQPRDALVPGAASAVVFGRAG
jgi:hypothetical protein